MRTHNVRPALKHRAIAATLRPEIADYLRQFTAQKSPYHSLEDVERALVLDE